MNIKPAVDQIIADALTGAPMSVAEAKRIILACEDIWLWRDEGNGEGGKTPMNRTADELYDQVYEQWQKHIGWESGYGIEDDGRILLTLGSTLKISKESEPAPSGVYSYSIRDVRMTWMSAVEFEGKVYGADAVRWATDDELILYAQMLQSAGVEGAHA